MYDLLNLFKEYQIVAFLNFCLSPLTVFEMGLHANNDQMIEPV